MAAVDGCGGGVAASLSGDGHSAGRVPINSTYCEHRKVQICKFFVNNKCKYGARCLNSHQSLPLYKHDLKNVVLKSAAEIAVNKTKNYVSKADESSHQPDSTEKKRDRMYQKSANTSPSKIKSQAQKGQGKNGSSILCQNKFSVLYVDSDNEEEEDYYNNHNNSKMQQSVWENQQELANYQVSILAKYLL